MHWRYSIARPLFLTLAIFASLIILTMIILMQFSIRQGLIEYVKNLELRRLNPVAQLLEQRYQQEGSWRFLQYGQPLAPFELLMPRAQGVSASLTADGRPTFGPEELFPVDENNTASTASQSEAQGDTQGLTRWQGARPDYSPPNSQDGLSLGTRVALYDVQGNYLAGNPNATFKPNRVLYLTVNGHQQAIGYLGLAHIVDKSDLAQENFLATQSSRLWMIGAGVMVVAGLMAVALAMYIRRPVSVLTEGARKLADGDLSVRLAVARRDEIGELAQEFNSMVERLEAYEQSRRQWVADTSHELRTPITILSTHLEAMTDGVIPANPERLGVLAETVANMNRLVGDLHQLASADAGAHDYRFEDVSIQEFLHNLVTAFTARMQQQELQLSLHSQIDPDSEIIVDRLRLQQVLSNLLTNSSRYTDAGGAVQVHAVQEQEQLRIWIDDSKPSVPADALPHLFDRFYRVDASRSRRSGGSGLGLAICRVIVDAHQGTINAEASPLGGLRVVITLPLTRDLGEKEDV